MSIVYEGTYYSSYSWEKTSPHEPKIFLTRGLRSRTPTQSPWTCSPPGINDDLFSSLLMLFFAQLISCTRERISSHSLWHYHYIFLYMYAKLLRVAQISYSQLAKGIPQMKCVIFQIILATTGNISLVLHGCGKLTILLACADYSMYQ